MAVVASAAAVTCSESGSSHFYPNLQEDPPHQGGLQGASWKPWPSSNQMKMTTASPMASKNFESSPSGHGVAPLQQQAASWRAYDTTSGLSERLNSLSWPSPPGNGPTHVQSAQPRPQQDFYSQQNPAAAAAREWAAEYGSPPPSATRGMGTPVPGAYYLGSNSPPKQREGGGAFQQHYRQHALPPQQQQQQQQQPQPHLHSRRLSRSTSHDVSPFSSSSARASASDYGYNAAALSRSLSSTLPSSALPSVFGEAAAAPHGAAGRARAADLADVATLVAASGRASQRLMPHQQHLHQQQHLHHQQQQQHVQAASRPLVESALLHHHHPRRMPAPAVAPAVATMPGYDYACDIQGEQDPWMLGLGSGVGEHDNMSTPGMLMQRHHYEFSSKSGLLSPPGRPLLPPPEEGGKHLGHGLAGITSPRSLLEAHYLDIYGGSDTWSNPDSFELPPGVQVQLISNPRLPRATALKLHSLQVPGRTSSTESDALLDALLEAPGSFCTSPGGTLSPSGSELDRSPPGGFLEDLLASANSNAQNALYKTELCRSWEETGACRYGSKCQFAHGKDELRPIARHPKYKTEICRTFNVNGTCPYGTRCRFIHSSSKDPKLSGRDAISPACSSEPGLAAAAAAAATAAAGFGAGGPAEVAAAAAGGAGGGGGGGGVAALFTAAAGGKSAVLVGCNAPSAAAGATSAATSAGCSASRRLRIFEDICADEGSEDRNHNEGGRVEIGTHVDGAERSIASP